MKYLFIDSVKNSGGSIELSRGRWGGLQASARWKFTSLRISGELSDSSVDALLSLEHALQEEVAQEILSEMLEIEEKWRENFG